MSVSQFGHNLCVQPTYSMSFCVFNMSWDVSCFVTWQRKEISLYDTKCLKPTRFSISVRLCSVAIHSTGCIGYLKPTVVQDQIPLDHIERGRYLYTFCRKDKNSCKLYMKKINRIMILCLALWVCA